MNRFAYIDALRGYAILAVIAVHCSQGAPGLAWPWRPLLDQGSRGVQLFYVASAITLCMSWHTRQDGAAAFYVRRLFRIAPLFWLAIPAFLAIEGFGPRYWAPSGIDWRHVTATALFVHGFHPQSITSVVPGSWTIANEMTFYAIFPALIFLLRSWWAALIAAVLSIGAATWLYPQALAFMPQIFAGEDKPLLANYATLWFPNQLPVFLIGIATYFAIVAVRFRSPLISRAILLASLAAMLALPFYQTTWQLHLLYSIAFAFFAFGLAHYPTRFLVHPYICWIGKISFGAYLWHFAILGLAVLAAFKGYDPLGLKNNQSSPLFFLMFYAITCAATFACAWVTYRLVEKPGIRLGTIVTDRLAMRRSSPALDRPARSP